MINVERLVRDYLAADAAVAALVGARVHTGKLPAEPTFPLVLLRRFAGAATMWGHFDGARVQIEAWSENGDHPACEELSRAVREAMKSQTIEGEYALGVVTGAQEFLFRFQEDPVTGRPRYLLDCLVFCHPAAA